MKKQPSQYIDQNIDVRVYCKLEKRAAKLGISVEKYVSLFLTKGVEPISQ